MSPAKRRQVVERVRNAFRVSERRACRAIQQPRSTRRYRVRSGEDEAPLTQRMVALATRYGWYGYRRITALLRREGWRVNHPCLPQGKCKRVERQLTVEDVQACLTELFCQHGLPAHMRSDNGPEFTAKKIR